MVTANEILKFSIHILKFGSIELLISVKGMLFIWEVKEICRLNVWIQYSCWQVTTNDWRYVLARYSPAPIRRFTGGLMLPIWSTLRLEGSSWLVTKGNLWYLHSWPSGFTACCDSPAVPRSPPLLRISLMVGGYGLLSKAVSVDPNGLYWCFETERFPELQTHSWCILLATSIH